MCIGLDDTGDLVDLSGDDLGHLLEFPDPHDRDEVDGASDRVDLADAGKVGQFLRDIGDRVGLAGDQDDRGDHGGNSSHLLAPVGDESHASAVTKAQFTTETTTRGEWKRQTNWFTHRVRANASDYPVESGRYHLIVSLACPWAHRSIIVRRLLGLERHIPMTVVDPIRDDRGWRFTEPVFGADFLSELYERSDPSFVGRWTVPTLYDTVSQRIVSNDYPQLTLDFDTEWRALHAPDAPDLYPEHLRQGIDEVAEIIYSEVNNGVYRCGFATTQDAYDEAYRRLFDRLDWLETRLSGQRYLMGDTLTEADVRLYTTLARFDAVYHGHFKCNRQKLSEFDALWAYARNLYQTPGFGDTTDFDHIKRHYYGTHDTINPTLIVPLGPDLSGWSRPHGRG